MLTDSYFGKEESGNIYVIPLYHVCRVGVVQAALSTPFQTIAKRYTLLPIQQHQLHYIKYDFCHVHSAPSISYQCI